MTAGRRFEFSIDEDGRTLRIAREFDGARQIVWDCHTKSSLLDRWFAPKPLTTKTAHMDFQPGGYWHYAMIMPTGEEYWSRIDYLTIQPIDGYTAKDGFSDSSGAVNADMPRSDWTVTFADAAGRTLVTTVVAYPSAEGLQTVLAMGMKEGMTSTLERLDELLPQLARETTEENKAAANRTTIERASDREVVVTRRFDAPARIVFEAWTTPEQFVRWWAPKSMGMTIRACEMDVRTGGKYRLEFGQDAASAVSFFGNYLEVIPAAKLVWTNDEDEAAPVTTVTFEETGGTTLVVLHELYPSKEAFEAMGGMDEALPEQFDQLDALLASLAG